MVQQTVKQANCHMAYEDLLAENFRLRARIRELEQEVAVQRLLAYNNGVLAATTAFGKTVAAIGIIARRKVNTLILVHSKALSQQWKEEIEKFLIISEPDPTAEEKKGRGRKRFLLSACWTVAGIRCTVS